MKTVMFIFWAGICSGVFVSDNVGQGVLSDNHVLNSDEAIDLALMYTGFGFIDKIDAKDSLNISAVKEIAADKSSDYSREFINNAVIWRVIYENVILNSVDISFGNRKAPAKDLKILIDDKSKKLLQIVGVNSESDIDITSTAILPEAAIPFETFGERYYGLPDMPPQIDFLTALDSSNCRVSAAKKITAVYVLYSYDRSRYKQYDGDTAEVIVPAWVIQLDGLSPWSTNGTKPEYTNQRVVIDGKSGKRIVKAFSFTRR